MGYQAWLSCVLADGQRLPWVTRNSCSVFYLIDSGCHGLPGMVVLCC